MEFKKPLLSICVLVLTIAISKGQTSMEDINIQHFIEHLFAQQDQPLDYAELYESLYQLYLNPIALNRANREELQATYLLSPLQLNAFFAYRENQGELLSIYELQAIPGFDLQTIYQLLPFVTVSESAAYSNQEPIFKKIFRPENSTLLIRYERCLEEKKGFSETVLKSDSSWTSRYLGSADKVYIRFRTHHIRDFSVGFTAEKDAGEQLVWSPATKRYGLDFWSFHLAVKNKGKVKAFVLGDYALQVGQGLLLGAGFAPGKGAETITTVRRGNLGIRPYTSVMESGFFRGAGATIKLNKLEVTTFYSNTLHDAKERTELDSLDHEKAYISSIQASGFHRTHNEIAAKSTTREQVAGANINYISPSNKLLVGLTALYTDFKTPIKRRPRKYNQFEFEGERNYNFGSYYSFNWQNINLFGEMAISKSGGLGLITGMMMNLSKKWEISLLYRRYDRDFHTLYGAAFSENSRNINERGVYLGFKYSPSRKLSFTAYFDQFRFPWLKYRVDAPSKGIETLFRFNYTPSKKIHFYGQYRREAKEINTDSESNLKTMAEGVKQHLLFNLDIVASDNINLKSRIQFSNYKIENQFSRGFVIAQDLNFSFWKFKVSTRAALFDTDNYENRQYVYERDVLYAFSIPAYFGKGIRNYVLVQYNLLHNLSLWVRFARTRYKNKESIGSGLETITGNTKTDLKCQIRYKF